MSDEDLLAELLLRWEELHEKGQDTSAEEMCWDSPHLAPLLAERIHALKVTAWMEKPVDDDCTQPDPTIQDAPRTLAGRYRLDAKIAEGGFAEVWNGYDLELRRAVAVKLPKPGRLVSAERFMAEARRVAGLKHPGVVPVFDVGREGDSCFIVSEFVEGGSLADRIAKNRPTPPEAERMVAEIAETLAYAHRQGFIHRDIKPANILLDHHGRALLTDFGIAFSPDDKGEGGSFGTLPYMSPEQVEGKALDHRSDIYSLGVVVYELLAGHLPHEATDPVELRRLIVSGTVTNIPGISKEGQRICRKCLSRNPVGRYQDAGKLATDLRQSAGPSAASRRLLVTLVGMLLVATVAGFVFFKLSRPATERPSDPGIVKTDEGKQPPPGTLEAALALGKLHANKKEWEKAEAAFTEAITLNPECAEAYHRRGGTRFNAGKVKESLPDFDVAARLDPKNAEVCKNRAFAYMKLVRLDDAVADLRHAQELDPNHPEPYRKALGLVYGVRAYEKTQEKKDAEAIADFTEAIKFDPMNAEFFDKRGSIHFNLGQFEEARKDFTQAIRLDPNQPAFFLHRGYSHEGVGKNDEAAEDYKKAKR